MLKRLCEILGARATLCVCFQLWYNYVLRSQVLVMTMSECPSVGMASYSGLWLLAWLSGESCDCVGGSSRYRCEHMRFWVLAELSHCLKSVDRTVWVPSC